MNDKKITREILFLKNISHVYNQEDQKIKVLNNINLKVFKGEMLACLEFLHAKVIIIKILPFK